MQFAQCRYKDFDTMNKERIICTCIFHLMISYQLQIHVHVLLIITITVQLFSKQTLNT